MKRVIGVRHPDTDYTLSLVKRVEVVNGVWVVELTVDTTQALMFKDEKLINMVLEVVDTEFKKSSGYIVDIL